MKKEMLINVKQPEECRIAIVEDGILEELYVERTSHESYTGNIYKGRIVNLEPAIQAAFVDFSVGRNGFLHVSDIESQYFERGPMGPPEPIDAAPRERERRRDPRREGGGDRNRGRDPRRRPPGPGPVDPSFGPPPVEPPRLDDFDDRPRGPDRDRSRDRPFGPPPIEPPHIEDFDDRPRGPDDRPRGPDRDRNRDRPRERERPDLSIKGRRDRSEPKPRRFGEGLVSQPEPWPEPEPELPVELVSLEPEQPFEQHIPVPPSEVTEVLGAGWPEAWTASAVDQPEELTAAEPAAPGWSRTRLPCPSQSRALS